MKKFLKVSAVIFLSFTVILVALYFTYLAVTSGCKLDKDKLLNVGQNIIITDENGDEILNTSLSAKRPTVRVGELNDYTVNAFISSEDRKFYEHGGLNYGRMVKAFFTNLKSRSFKQGASTISQQLIKNTHLSSDKTISRKLKEIRLTKKLEKSYSKDEILEMYLNTIYFGHNCYGLQSAANFYFDKRAENLDLQESATLVGLLTSPNNYSPFKNPEKSLAKRNIVLKNMAECGFITQDECDKTINCPLNAKRSEESGNYSDYVNAVFDELEDANLSVYDLSDGCTIKTYINCDMQKFIESLQFECDNSVIITDRNGGVCAYKSTISGAKRQPGSTAKPLMVYAPAMEEGLAFPYTKILDEKIDFNGYSPENYDGKYHGYVTVADSLKHSYNIPAVKTLNALTVNKSEKYLKAMNIALEDDEKNLAVALGGMKYGLSLKQIADCYSVFPAGGTYTPSRFIKSVTAKDGKEIYSNDSGKSRIFSQGVCSLMNEMLIDTAKSGTAKKLKNCKFDVAAKTGTCGNSEGNTDAYAIGYTSAHTLGVWLGDKNNEKLQITGGGKCCEYLLGLLNEIYSENAPQNLDVESGTKQIQIDAEEYRQNNKVILADPVCPKLNIVTIKTLDGTEHLTRSTKFSNPSISAPSLSAKNGTVTIELCHAKYYSYLVERTKNGKKTVIYDGKWCKNVTDKPTEGFYSYSVTPYFEADGKKYIGQTVNLPTVSVGNNNGSIQVKIPDIINDEWYNM